MPETYFCQDVSASNMSHISDKSGNWLLNYTYLKVNHQIDDCSSFWIRIRFFELETTCTSMSIHNLCETLFIVLRNIRTIKIRTFYFIWLYFIYTQWFKWFLTSSNVPWLLACNCIVIVLLFYCFWIAIVDSLF